MSELTRIITMEVTMISKGENAPDKEEAKNAVEKAIKETLGADDVNILKVQDFVNEED